MQTDPATDAVLLAAGLIFLLALILGVWKYRQMVTSEKHLAHPYVDIAHRAALMYSFATMMLAVFVQFSEFSTAVNLIAAFVPIFFFVSAIVSYIVHGALRDTTNQLAHPMPGTHAFFWLLVVGEIGGFSVLLAGFAQAQIL
ncbi:MAG: hypothetical protein HY827_05215 [Actinobacteria bacterium]|nr:hypothetical protein [Actinomycetota bacterium]